MGEAQPLKLMIVVQEANNAAKADKAANIPNNSPIARDRRWWARVTIYALFVLCGESAATLLGRLYYSKGGNSKWIATLVQIAGFPILLPYYCLSTPRVAQRRSNKREKKRARLAYASLGLINGAVCLFHSIGLSYLPVSTYSLICASQLSFSAFFSFLLNSQKLTPYVLNSLVLLTLSSVLLLFQADSAGPPKAYSYVAGFVYTIVGSAGYGLVLSLTQSAMQRAAVEREGALAATVDATLYVSLGSTAAALAGLFCSGEWRGVGAEMEGFGLGGPSYLATLACATVSWQLFNVGEVGLILEVSSLFSNVVGVLSLPVVPVLGVVFFDDRIDGVKVISMVLAIWGLLSYVYQHYVGINKSMKNHEGKRNDAEQTTLERQETNA